MKRYEPITYGVSFAVHSPEVPLFTKPNWFARVFLRRKPQRLPSVVDISKRLGDAALAEQERVLREIFERGIR